MVSEGMGDCAVREVIGLGVNSGPGCPGKRTNAMEREKNSVRLELNSAIGTSERIEGKVCHRLC